MANELEVAEELANSSPDQAMELLSSIGKLIIVFDLLVQALFL